MVRSCGASRQDDTPSLECSAHGAMSRCSLPSWIALERGHRRRQVGDGAGVRPALGLGRASARCPAACRRAVCACRSRSRCSSSSVRSWASCPAGAWASGPAPAGRSIRLVTANLGSRLAVPSALADLVGRLAPECRGDAGMHGTRGGGLRGERVVVLRRRRPVLREPRARRGGRHPLSPGHLRSWRVRRALSPAPW